MIKKIKEESWIVFIRSVYISQGQTVFIGFNVANNKASLGVKENLFNLKIKVVIEKYAYPCFIALVVAKNSLVALFCRPYLISVFSAVNLL